MRFIMIQILLLFLTSLAYSQDISNQNSTISNDLSSIYMPPYKTQNYDRYKTKNIPTLVNSDGMLKNLDLTYWTLKFYSHPDIALYNYIDLSFENDILQMKIVDFSDNVVNESSYHLSPIKMFKPNEGIFAYSDTDGQLQFVYLHLLLEYLLAVKMVSSYEEAEEVSQQSITELGIFTLR